MSPARIFVSYSHEDSRWLGEDSLIPWLARSLRREKIEIWFDREGLPPGVEFRQRIEHEIDRAQVAILLVSQQFLNSPFIEDVELPRIKARVERSEMLAVPILVEPCGWEENEFLSARQMLPGKPTPLINYVEREAAWVNVRAEILAGLKKTIRMLPQLSRSLEPVPEPQPKVKQEELGRTMPSRTWLAVFALVVSGILVFGIRWIFLDERPAIVLQQPADGAILVGPQLKYEWQQPEKLPGRSGTSVSVDIERLSDNGRVVTANVVGNSFIEPTQNGLEGRIRWRARVLWKDGPGTVRPGEWSATRTLFYYPTALRKVLLTKTVHLGIAEEDGIFVKSAGTELAGYEIEVLRHVFDRVFERNGVQGSAKITYTYRSWGDAFFRLLDNEDVDLLASGISITEGREKAYGLKFSHQWIEYPQSIITRHGDEAPFKNGRFVAEKIGVARDTTNEPRACTILGDDCEKRLTRYSGSNVYADMMKALVLDQLDAVVIDQPYAIRKVREWIGKGYALDRTDLTPDLEPGIQSERIGFAVRSNERELLDAINEALDHSTEFCSQLARKFLVAE